MSQDSLMVDYPGICEVVFNGDCIKAKSKIDDWKALPADVYKLDQIMQKLADIAAKYKLWERFWDCGDCLMSHTCESEETAKAAFAELRDFTPKELEETPQASAKESADERIDAELPEVSEVAIADIFKWKLNLPAYQRPYRWGQENVESLWDDIKESRGRYDFGMIVIIKSGAGYDIVDGQQRLVTISLMLRSLDSDAADAFIQNTTLQGRASEENIARNFQFLMRQAARLSSNKEELAKKILEARADVVVMDDLDDALKFFNRMNTAGIELTQIDILKSHHLLALANENALTDEAKARWRGRGFVPDACLDNPKEFKNEVVRTWERYEAWVHNMYVSRASVIRMMARGQYPYSLDNIWDKGGVIEDFRGGKYPDGIVKYEGLTSPIQDGEFFFWYVFNIHDRFDKLFYKEHQDGLAAHHDWLLTKPMAKDFFRLIVVYLHEKFPKDANTEKFNRVLDLLFSWLADFCLNYDVLRFRSIRNSAMEGNSLFMALLSSKKLEDCFDCYCKNPLDGVKDRWDWWRKNNPASVNGRYYLIRKELRRIWSD